MPTIDERRAARARLGRAEVARIRDRRRFKETAVPSGETRMLAHPDATGTMFPGAVRDWVPGIGEYLLKDGAHNSKIGGDVAVGAIAGASIYTLSWEERATCPRGCEHWRSCYGNNMNRARRWRSSAGTGPASRPWPAWCLAFGQTTRARSSSALTAGRWSSSTRG